MNKLDRIDFKPQQNPLIDIEISQLKQMHLHRFYVCIVVSITHLRLLRFIYQNKLIHHSYKKFHF